MLTYLVAVVGGAVLVGLAARIKPGLDADGCTRGTIRFLAMGAAGGCAVATWGAAVVMLPVPRVVWPLALATGFAMAGAGVLLITH